MTLTGRVISAAGHSIRGARVAIYAPGSERAQKIVVTEHDGRFAALVVEGKYALTATAAGYSAAFLAEYNVGEDSAAVELVVEKPDRFIRGTVRDESGRGVPRVLVRASLAGVPAETRLFYTATDGQGQYELDLPDDRYDLAVEPGNYISLDATYYKGGHERVDLVAYPWRRVKQAAGEDVIDWMRSHAIPLATVVAGSGLQDLYRLKSVIGDARIVGLGEQTHGTREFFQMKHRIVEYLVTELDFTVFAIEGSLPDAMAIDDYILHGRGAAGPALAGMHFWTWDTEEVLAMIEWMRKYNANPIHPRKIRFYGFDMQHTAAAVSRILDFVARTAPSELGKTTEDLKLFSSNEWRVDFSDLTTEEKLAARRQVGRVALVLDSLRTDTEKWARARQCVTVIQQALERLVPSTPPRENARDRAMAENVRWIDERHPEARIILWSHNEHISRLDSGLVMMGGHLARQFGARYRALALVFGSGSFQAIDRRLGEDPLHVVEHTVDVPPGHYFEAAFARVGSPLFVLDLRNRPRAGPVSRWFDTPHPLRIFGSVYLPSNYPWGYRLLDEEFDALLFIDRTTRARPTPTGRRPRQAT